jgi:hypothetical protein
MNAQSSLRRSISVTWFTHSLVAIGISLLAVLIAGCGGSSGSGMGKTFSGNTTVVLLGSSTANDQLSQFSVTVWNLTLTSQSGQTVSVLAAPVSDEFMHLNGLIEPLATVSIPQGIYTSAAATISGLYPTCAGQSSGDLLVDESLGGIDGLTPAAIEMPQPITVTGTAMGLVLNLQVSKTVVYSGGCSQSLTNTLLFTPTFSVTPLTIAAQPTNSANGKVVGVEGLISSVGANAAELSIRGLSSMNEGNAVPAWQVNLNSGTVVQGVGSAAALSAGMPVDIDLTVQPDGHLLATRVAVYDTNAASLNIAFGPPLAIYATGAYQTTYPAMNSLEVEQSGDLSGLTGLYTITNATFQISGQLANLKSLPFAVSFNVANMVEGQNVLFTTHGPIANTTPIITQVTLLPQTINGTVSAISNAGEFTTYIVTLAPYDLFPNLAVQPGQNTLLTNPNTVVVYADSNTQMLNSSPLSVGSLFRFYGLVFNDNGTLRMDSAQISDGVTE